jgi:hypothetical protein
MVSSGSPFHANKAMPQFRDASDIGGINIKN